MTHEQKPESAEFRTRDILLPCPFCGAPAERLDFNDGENIGGSCISCTRCGASGHVEFGFKENFVSQWNTRINNAAEQYRKDADGARPVAYRWRVESLPGFHTPWSLEASHPFPDGARENEVVEELVVAANVAALEARVKELEAELAATKKVEICEHCCGSGVGVADTICNTCDCQGGTK